MATATKTLKSHPGTLGCRVLSIAATDTHGREWPKGTAYRPVSAGSDQHGSYQTIKIESRQYQGVLTEGFGETATFRF